MSTAIPRPRRNFTVEQKLHAARLVREQSLSVSALAKTLQALRHCLQLHYGRPSTASGKLQRPVPSSVHYINI